MRAPERPWPGDPMDVFFLYEDTFPSSRDNGGPIAGLFQPPDNIQSYDVRGVFRGALNDAERRQPLVGLFIFPVMWMQLSRDFPPKNIPVSSCHCTRGKWTHFHGGDLIRTDLCSSVKIPVEMFVNLQGCSRLVSKIRIRYAFFFCSCQYRQLQLFF